MDRPELATRAQLRGAGLSDRRRQELVRTGALLEPGPRILTSTGLTPAVIAHAALERAGSGAGLSHQSGGALWIGRELTGMVHVRLPPGRRLRDVPGVRCHQSRLPFEVKMVSGFPVVAADRVGADIAASDELEEADRRALVTALVQRRRTTADEIAAACIRTERQRRAQVRRLVEELLAGALSGPEARVWRGQVEERMPVPMLNHRVGRRWLDGYLPPLRAGYEVQSRTYHAGTWLPPPRWDPR